MVDFAAEGKDMMTAMKIGFVPAFLLFMWALDKHDSVCLLYTYLFSVVSISLIGYEVGQKHPQ